MADIKERIVIEAVDNTTRGMRSAQNKLNAFDRTLKRVQTTMMGFVGINIATHMIQGITKMSDSAVELDAKLRLMTDSTEDFNYAQEELVKLSLESGSSLEANTILFTRMNRAIKSMGGTTQTTLDTTRALSQGLRISGASTQESASVIRQWSQAMASGVLRGEEFNAVSENGARIIEALSDSLGVSIGELRAMSKEGELTAQVVTEALLKQSKVLQEENAKLPLTIGRAIENINTQWTLLLQSMSKGNEGVATSINGIAENFDNIAKSLGVVIKLTTAYFAVGLFKSSRERLIQYNAEVRNHSAILLEQKVLKAKIAQEERANNAKRIADYEIELSKLKESELALIQEQAIKENIEKDRVASEAKKRLAEQKESQAQAKKQIDLQKEKFAKQELIVLETKLAMSTAQRSLEEANLSLRKLKDNQAIINSEQAINLQNVKSLEGLQRKQLAQLENATSAKKQNIVNQKLLITEKHLAVAREHQNLISKETIILANEESLIKAKVTKQEELLIVATQKLIVSTQELTTLKDLETLALGRNSQALNVNTVANVANSKAVFNATDITSNFNTVAGKSKSSLAKSAKGFGLLKSAISGVGAFLGRLGSAILGLPGLIAYAGYEIGKHFFDWGLMLDLLIAKYKQGLLKIAEHSLILNPFGLMTERYRKWSDDLETKLEKSFQDHLEYEEAVKAGFDNIAEYKQHLVKQEIEAEKQRVQQIATLEEQRQALVDSKYVISEKKLKEHIDLMNNMRDSDTEVFQEKIDKIQFEADIEIKTKEEAFNEIAELTKVHLNEQIDLYTEFYDNQLNQLEQGSKEYLELERTKFEAIKQLNNDRIENTKDMITNLIDLENDAVNSIKDAKEKLRDLEQDHADFLRELNGDQRADWQKNLDAQKERDRIAKQLRKADSLDAEGKGVEAQKLRDDAINGLKQLITSEKKRSEELQKGSLDEIRARSNTTNATNLYKEAVNDSIKSQKDQINTGQDIANKAREQINNLTEDLKGLEAVSQSVQSEISDINSKLSEIESIDLDVNTDEVYRQIEAIDSKIKSLSQDVVVNVKTVKSGGNGDDDPVQRATGGFIPRSNGVPGSGSGDKVKALLEPGEFIMRKSAVQKYGTDAMYAMNNGDDPIRRRLGGIIPGIHRFATGGSINESFTEDSLIELMKKYEDRYLNFVKAGRNADGAIESYSATSSANYTKKMMENLSNLKGKSPDVVSNVLDLNEKIHQFFVSHARGMKMNEGSKLRSLFDLRDVWQKFAEGGSVPGSGLGDTVKALLTPGEFVMKKGAVASFGTDFMNSINQGIMPQRFATGGLVGAGADGVETINVNFNMNGSEATGSFTKNDATMQFIDQLKSSEASS